MNEDCIGRNPVAFGQHDKIATHHLPAGNAFALAVSNDQGTRTCEVAKGFEDALGATLLDDRNRNRHGREHEQDDGLLQVA